jgi:hypothetical protein
MINFACFLFGFGAECPLYRDLSIQGSKVFADAERLGQQPPRVEDQARPKSFVECDVMKAYALRCCSSWGLFEQFKIATAFRAEKGPQVESGINNRIGTGG